MRIQKLSLRNFRGVKELDIDFGGRSAAIYGANGTGKTTIANAVAWLLTGKSSTGEKNFSPKTVGVHKAEHSAEIILTDGNNKEISFKKVFKEKYKKPRGGKVELVGHETLLYVDGLKANDKRYQQEIGKLLGGVEDIESVLITGHFTQAMGVKERREVLFSLFNGRSDALINQPEWAELKAGIGDGTVEEYHNGMEARRKDKVACLERIPNGMALLRGMIKEIMPAPDGDEEAVLHQIASLEKRLEDLQRSTGSSNREMAKAKLLQEMNEARECFYAAQREQEKKAYAEYWQLKDREMKLDSQVNRDESTLQGLQRGIAALEEMRGALRKEFGDIVRRAWDDNQAICPTCHQALPADQVEGLKRDFTDKKAADKEEIIRRGNANNRFLEEKMGQAEAVKVELAKNRELLEKARADLQGKSPELADKISFENTADGMEYKRKLSMLDSAAVDEGTGDWQREIDMLKQGLEIKRDILAKMRSNSDIEEQMAALQAQQKEALKDLEAYEKAVYMADQFMEKRAKLAEEDINHHFSYIKFKLFEPCLNGGYKEVCEPLIPNADGEMVDYKSANTAAQVNADLEIIEALAQAYGITVPVFIDGAERVSHIRKMDCQCIALRVSDKDKAVRIELEEDITLEE